MTKKRLLGKTGLMVSEIGFGALEIGRDWAADVNPDPSHLTESEAAKLLNSILDLDIDFIDTAPAYWYSEEFIGKAISHRRKEFTLATKVGEHCDRSGSLYDYSYDGTLKFIDASLKKLHTDRIDLIQIHSASIEVLEQGETYSALKKAKDEGKVIHIGMTGNVEACIRAIEIGGYETVQFPYNLIATEAEEKLFRLAEENSIGTIIMRPLAGGKLTEKFERLADEKLRETIQGFLKLSGDHDSPDWIANLALGYILSNKNVSTVIAGSRYISNIQKNLEISDNPLPAEIIKKTKEYIKTTTSKAW